MCRKKILLVENEMIIALDESARITRLGYEVLSVNSGEAAVKSALGDATILLILMDIDLGEGIDGPEAARRILTKRDLPIVFLTSHSEREMVEKVRGITRYGYVLKNSGDFVLQSSIEMAFELFEASEKIRERDAAIQQSEILYRSVVTAMAEGVELRAANGEVVAVNPAAERIIGRSAEEMQGRIPDEKQWMAIHEDGRPCPIADHPALATLQSGKPLSNVVIGLGRTDGAIVWVSINTQPLFSPGESKPYSVVATFRDITEQRQAEKALELEEYLMQALMNNSPDYIYFKDRESRFIRASKALAQSFGLDDPGLLTGKRDFDFFTEEHARQAYDDEQAIIRSGQALSKEEKETRTGRPNAWVVSDKLPLRGKRGEIIGTFGISRDITDRKHAEERIEFQARLYATLSRINRTIIHTKERIELFEKICDAAVVTGKFRMAWIGLLDEAGVKIVRVAQAEHDADYLAHRSEIISEIPLTHNPIGSAIHSGKVVLYEDPADTGRKTNGGGDYRSTAAIPFGKPGCCAGVLNIYATEIGFFSQEERNLLEEIGLDISFALEKMELARG
jgi:PAS domain S-box-containing protein